MDSPSPLFRDMIGWISSLILFLTISQQVYTQWKEETSKGVSKWLYIGQLVAEVGFITYSWMVGNWVFVVTNALVLLSNIAGLLIVNRHRRRRARAQAGAVRESALGAA